MANDGLESEFLKSLKSDAEVSSAVQNPVQFGDLFGATLGQFAGAGLKNVDSLSGNVLEAIAQGEQSNVYKDIAKTIGSDKDVLEKLIGVAKAPFSDTKSGIISALFGEDSVSNLSEELTKNKETKQKKQDVASQFNLDEAGLAVPAAELVASLPIARFGTMANTTAAVKAGMDSVSIAKSVTKDMAKNALSMGSSELALAKFYGKSDEEAIGNALVASTLGVGGTAVLGGRQVIKEFSKTTPKELAQIKLETGQPLSEEEMSILAGGGKETIATKSGREFESEDVKKSKQAIESVEFDVVTPVKERKPISENTYVPTVSNPLKFKYGYDERGRVYVEQGSLLSPQGTAEQKASLKLKDKTTITSATDEVNRRLEFYNNEEKLRKAYGQSQAKFIKENATSGNQDAIAKQKFIKDQYAEIMKNKALSKDIRQEARANLSKLNKEKIERVQIDKELSAKVDKLYEKQSKIEDPIGSTRDSELREEFKAFTKGRGDKEGFERKPTKSNQEMVTTIAKKAIFNRANVKEAIKRINKQEKLLGRNKFNESKITDDIRRNYSDDSKIIEDFQARREDLDMYAKGSLSPDELRFREQRRIEDEIKSETKTFNNKEELETYLDDVVARLDDIGIYQDRNKLKAEFKNTFYGIEKAEKKAIREAKELEKSKYQHQSTLDRIKAFRKTGKRQRGKNGKYTLSESQVRDIKEGYLSDVEIANKTSPIGINAKRQELITEAREHANKKVNTKISKDLGIKSRFKEPEKIIFSDVVKDASNSVAQIFSVLISSKRLGALSKLTGQKVDIREAIGEAMSDAGIIKPKTIGENGEEMTWKDVIKPIFMTKNYGQGDIGLAKNFAKTHNISIEDANKFIEDYNTALNKVAPEFKALSDAIYDIYSNSNKTTFSWTLPDGFKVEFKLAKEKNGTVTIQGQDYKVNLKTDDFDEYARAIMPNIIHSVDAYIARRLNLKKFTSIHDAFIANPKDIDRLALEYSKILEEINDSNLLDSILKDIGYDGKSFKVEGAGKLTKEDIRGSEYKLGTEHEAGIEEKSKYRTLDVSRQSTPIDVMKDYMSSGNYRQIPTKQLVDSMVNEAGFNNAFIKLAREGDDPFERQVALAMQSENYNPKLAIPVPDGVNAKVWDIAQREIFNEARAKLEYNPLLVDVIQGKRIHFEKNGRIIGDTTKTKQEIMTEQIRIANKLLKSKNRARQRELGSVNKIQRTVSSIKEDQPITFNQAKAVEFMDEVRREATIQKPNQWKTLWKEQTSDEQLYTQFNNLELVKNRYKAEVERSTEILYKRLKEIPKDKVNTITRITDSDYNAIRGMNEDTANAIWNNNKHILDLCWKEINQIAKAMTDQSEQYGYYLNNAIKVAERYNLNKESAVIIDQLISIKAMRDNGGWKALKDLGDDADLKFVLDTINQNVVISKGKLFTDSPDKFVKGYKAEVYLGNKRIDEDGNIKYDAESKYEEGVLGSDRENDRVGKLLSDDDVNSLGGTKFDSLADELEFMTKNRLKKTNGQYRKISGSDIRREAGKTMDLAEVLSETHRSILTKVKERNVIDKVLQDIVDDDSLLYSSTPKDGMIKLSIEQLNKLPFDLRSEMKYVNSELSTKLLGRDEVRLYSSGGNNLKSISEFVGKKLNKNHEYIFKESEQVLKIADRLLSNLGTAFKQNVVLKNPTSYVNSMLVNQTIGLSAGLSPKQLYKYQSKCISDLKEMNMLLDKLTKQKLTGEKLDKAMVNRLQNNMLYRMERAGLSTNRVEGVVGGDDLLSSILEDHVPSPIFKLARTLNLNQKTTAGRATLRWFSNIDTMGRYSIVQKLVDDGMHINDAVKEANGLYGDMDKMVPPVIEMLDKYGFAPFLKWFTLTSPKLLQLTKNNPKKAIAVGVTTYMLGSETNTNLNTVNPIEALIDFTDNTLPFGTIEKIQKNGLLDTMSNRANSNVLPKYLNNDLITTLYKLRKQRIGEPKYETSVDYRGLTQQIIG